MKRSSPGSACTADVLSLGSANTEGRLSSIVKNGITQEETALNRNEMKTAVISTSRHRSSRLNSDLKSFGMNHNVNSCSVSDVSYCDALLSGESSSSSNVFGSSTEGLHSSHTLGNNAMPPPKLIPLNHKSNYSSSVCGVAGIDAGEVLLMEQSSPANAYRLVQVSHYTPSPAISVYQPSPAMVYQPSPAMVYHTSPNVGYQALSPGMSYQSSPKIKAELKRVYRTQKREMLHAKQQHTLKRTKLCYLGGFCCPEVTDVDNDAQIIADVLNNAVECLSLHAHAMLEYLSQLKYTSMVMAGQILPGDVGGSSLFQDTDFRGDQQSLQPDIPNAHSILVREVMRSCGKIEKNRLSGDEAANIQYAKVVTRCCHTILNNKVIDIANQLQSGVQGITSGSALGDTLRASDMPDSGSGVSPGCSNIEGLEDPFLFDPELAEILSSAAFEDDEVSNKKCRVE